ncbi:MAG: hypothetical protein HY043_23415 [Verrucomicrobia bacterium]|nr:hypothetical protein [Verrucomicrobiota bacterium]
MKRNLHLAFALLIPATLFAAEPSPKDDVTAAAKKLGDQANYTWKTTVVVPDSAPFKPGPTEGKTEKDGFTYITMSFGDNLTEAVKKGDKAAITDMEGNWKLASELENAEGPARFFSMMVKQMKTPGAQVADLVAAAKELKKEGDAYSAEMTEDGAKKQFRFGEPKNPKGSVKFWIKDGSLVKFETKVEARMEFNGNEFDAARTTTTEIKEVGTTKVNAPEAAQKKLS